MSQKVPFRWHGCPTYKTAEKTLREVLAEEGMDAQVKLVAVNTDEEARQLRFSGSPTVRVDGKDLFPAGEPEDWRLWAAGSTRRSRALRARRLPRGSGRR